MLDTVRAYVAYHVQAAVYSFQALWQRPLAAMNTILIIAVALTLPALFWVFTDNLRQITLNWQESGHISLYLKPSLSTAEEQDFLQSMQTQAGVAQAVLKTRDQGLAELQKQEGMHDIMRYLPSNPLPPLIEIAPASTINTPIKMQELFNHLKQFPQVDQVKLDMEWVHRLHAILSFIGKITQILVILLACTVVLIVGNTLRLAIRNRQEEIKVLKLIGATDGFITRPFLYAGIWYGLIGAIFAVLFVNIFMICVAMALEPVAFVYHMHYPLSGLSVKQAYLILLFAVILSWLGAGLSVRRQLSSIEPYD